MIQTRKAEGVATLLIEEGAAGEVRYVISMQRQKGATRRAAGRINGSPSAIVAASSSKRAALRLENGRIVSIDVTDARAPLGDMAEITALDWPE